MAESIGALRAELSAGHAQFASDMKKARDAVVTNAQGMAKGMETAQKSFNAGTAGLMSFRVKALAAATVTGMLAKTVINMADDYTLLDNKLKLVTTSSDNLKAVQEGLYQQSLRSHSSYSSSVDLYARFAKATESIGTSQSDLIRITETLNKAMVISGATQQEATNGIIQLSQGMASGVLRGEEFNSIMENGSRNAKMLSGVELTVRGDTPEEKAASFLDALIKHGLAEVQDDKSARIPIPSLVWQGIDAVRLSGLTNMLGRPVVARLAGELGYPDAASWIEEHPKEYAEGVFRGFIVDPQGGKS